MKRILMIFAVAMAAVSCLDKATYTQSGTVFTHFDFYSSEHKEISGADSLYYDTTNKIGLLWDCFAFYHKVGEDGEFKGGFLLSCLVTPESGADGFENNLYRVNCKAVQGYADVNNFMIFHQTDQMPQQDVMFTYKDVGTCAPKYCMVNNTVGVTEAISELFEDGDKMIFKVSGYKEGKYSKSAEITMASDTVMRNWTVFDLSSLGLVDSLDFSVILPEGKDVPAVVCIDNFQADVTISY